MPPKARTEVKPTIERWMVRDSVGRIMWFEVKPQTRYFGPELLAYGWSDGIMTWTEERA